MEMEAWLKEWAWFEPTVFSAEGVANRERVGLEDKVWSYGAWLNQP